MMTRKGRIRLLVSLMITILLPVALILTPVWAAETASTSTGIPPHAAVNVFFDQQHSCVAREFVYSNTPLGWNYCWVCSCNQQKWECNPPFQDYRPDDDGDGYYDDGFCEWILEYDIVNQIQRMICSDEYCDLDQI